MLTGKPSRAAAALTSQFSSANLSGETTAHEPTLQNGRLAKRPSPPRIRSNMSRVVSTFAPALKPTAMCLRVPAALTYDMLMS
jgi:hypothetical protein